MASNRKPVYFPLVRANAFIGLEQFHERSRKIVADAILLTKKQQAEQDEQNRSYIRTPRLTVPTTSANCRHCIDATMDSRINLQLKTTSTTGVQFNVGGSSATVRYNALLGINVLTRKRKPVDESGLLNVAMWEDSQPPTKKQKFSFDAGLSTSRGLKCKSVVNFSLLSKTSKKINGRGLLNRRPKKVELGRYRSVIGMDLLDKPAQVVHDTFRSNDYVQRNKQSQNKSVLPKIDQSKPSELSPLVRCNAVIGMALLGDIRETNVTASPFATPAKPKQIKQQPMSKEQLLRKEAAVQRWNAKYGTKYTLI